MVREGGNVNLPAVGAGQQIEDGLPCTEWPGGGGGGLPCGLLHGSRGNWSSLQSRTGAEAVAGSEIGRVLSCTTGAVAVRLGPLGDTELRASCWMPEPGWIHLSSRLAMYDHCIKIHLKMMGGYDRFVTRGSQASEKSVEYGL